MKKKWYSFGNLEDCVLYDLCVLIAEKVTENENLRNLFLDLYKSRFPSIVSDSELFINLIILSANVDKLSDAEIIK